MIGRAIDTKIAESLFMLPIPGAEAGGDNVLAFRNLVRGKFYDLPSGEAIAGAMGVPVVGDEPENSMKARRSGTTCFAKPN